MSRRMPSSEAEVVHRLAKLKYEYGAPERQPRCYVCGPMTGLPEFNQHSFNRAAAMLREAGWFVYNPVENDAEAGIALTGLDGSEEFDFKKAMQRDLWQVCDSDAVFVLPGWEESKGAGIETHVAEQVGVPIYSILSGENVLERGRAIQFDEATDIPATLQAIANDLGWDDLAFPRLRTTTIDSVTGQPILVPEGAAGGHTAQVPEGQGEPPALDFGPEWRATDPVTGGSKGRKQAVFANMSLVADVYEARVHGFGVMKYPDEEGAPNWSRGMPFSWFYDALRRHIAAFWSGETINPESGLPHLAHARWMISNLIEYVEYGMGTDDRPAWRKRRAA